MSHVAPLPDAALGEFAEDFAMFEARMGFVPASIRTMARKPEMARGFLALARGVLGPECSLAPETAQLVAHIASAAAGCRYCEAHTGHVAERLGVAPGKIAAVWSFETSPLFSDAERAALALALAAAQTPSCAGPEHFEAARAFYSEEQLVEIVGVVSLFGFLNRWNAAMATELEDSPLAFAEAHLAPRGWRVGKHRG